MAITPVAALMFRFNNPDALLVLLLVAGAYCLVRALEGGAHPLDTGRRHDDRLRFLGKDGPGVPGRCPRSRSSTRWRRRSGCGAASGRCSLGGVAIVVSAGWWVAIVALWPAGSRPMIDGSSDNSILNLITGYNGLGRIFGGSGPGGGGGGANFSGSTGVAAPVQQPDGRPGLVAAAGRAARARRRPVGAAACSADGPGAGRATALGRVAGRQRPRLQPRQRRHPHLLHGRAGSRDRRAGGGRRLDGVDGARLASCPGRRDRERGAERRVGVGAAGPHPDMGAVAAHARARRRGGRGSGALGVHDAAPGSPVAYSFRRSCWLPLPRSPGRWPTRHRRSPPLTPDRRRRPGLRPVAALGWVATSGWAATRPGWRQPAAKARRPPARRSTAR